MATTGDKRCPVPGCRVTNALDKVIAAETRPIGTVEVLVHVASPWHGAATRATHLDGRITLHETLSAAWLSLELDPPHCPTEQRHEFLDAVMNALHYASNMRPRDVLYLHAATGEITVAGSDPAVTTWIGYSTSFDSVATHLRDHPLWTARFTEVVPR